MLNLSSPAESPLIDPKEAQILRAFILGKPREFVLAHPEIKLSILQKWRFKQLAKKRERGAPLAYLLGHKEFFGLNFLVNKYTLIPRPETEILVETVLEKLKKINGNCTLIDVGTGTGCIPIVVLKNNQKINALGTDISRAALRVARHNAKRNRVALTLLHGNLLERVPHNVTGTIIITANLPYLDEEEFASEPSIQHEPKTALVATENGLAIYRELLQQMAERQWDNASLFFEINPHQTKALEEIVKHYFPAARINFIPDLAGRNRVAAIEVYKETK